MSAVGIACIACEFQPHQGIISSPKYSAGKKKKTQDPSSSLHITDYINTPGFCSPSPKQIISLIATAPKEPLVVRNEALTSFCSMKQHSYPLQVLLFANNAIHFLSVQRCALIFTLKFFQALFLLDTTLTQKFARVWMPKNRKQLCLNEASPGFK